MATPSSAPKTKSRLRAAAVLVVSMLVGAAVGVVAARYLSDLLPDTRFSGVEKAVAAVVLVVLVVAAIAVHEAGHLLGGRLAGFRALLFVVGPFRVERTGTGVRASLHRNAAIAGGLAVSVPEDTHALRRRTLLLVAGGPAASILTGVLALALRGSLGLAPLPADAGYAHALAAVAIVAYGVTSLGLGAVTLFPARTGGFYSDGARILRLLRSGPNTDREVALLTLVALSMGGRRPREWDPALVAQSLAAADGTPFDAVARQVAYSHALDRGEPEEARRHLDAALAMEEVLPPVSRPGLLLQAAFFAAAVDGDGVRARALFARAGAGLMVPPHQRLLAEAAVCQAEGDARRAADLLDRAEAQLDRSLDRGGAVVDLEHIRRLRGSAAREPAGSASREVGLNAAGAVS